MVVSPSKAARAELKNWLCVSSKPSPFVFLTKYERWVACSKILVKQVRLAELYDSKPWTTATKQFFSRFSEENDLSTAARYNTSDKFELSYFLDWRSGIKVG